MRLLTLWFPQRKIKGHSTQKRQTGLGCRFGDFGRNSKSYFIAVYEDWTERLKEVVEIREEYFTR
jgi:hypothetical protein